MGSLASSYDKEFFTAREARAAASAEVIVPLILSIFPAESVVDVGCANGLWLRTFERHGVTDYLGVDGDYVPRDMLRIPQDRFKEADLSRPADLPRRFDIGLSLEVAEHLPPGSAARFVDFLTSTAPVVVFSAAVPGQGGTGHVNEQWQSYWQDLFARRGYLCLDCIRPAVYANPEVSWWYRQNILVYCRPTHLPRGYAAISSVYELNRIDPALVHSLATGPHGNRDRIKAIFRNLSALGSACLGKVIWRRSA